MTPAPRNLGLGFSLALTIAMSIATAAPCSAASRFAVGDPVAFTLITAEGQTLDSTEIFEGFITVVHFWAALSEPSVEHLPEMNRLFDAYRMKGVALLSVSVDPEPAHARQVIEELGLAWIFAHNAEQLVPTNRQFFADRYGVPHTFLLAPDGTLIWEGHPHQLEAQMKNALIHFPPDADPAPLARRGFVEPVAEPNQVARLASEAVIGNAPDFGELFKQTALLPADAHDQAKVKAFGRAVQRALGKLNAAQQEVYDLYRTTHPDTAAALDAWLAASARSISDSTGDSTSVSPVRVASKFQQAEAAQDAGDDLAAYELYRWIVNRAPNSDEALLAQDVVLALEADEAFMAQVAAQKREAKAENLMAMARNFTAAGHDDKAQELYEKVIADYSDTNAAKDAAAAMK
ncbi:MAG: TlpA disulfide reductase family protein [Planctomycetota bacterium]